MSISDQEIIQLLGGVTSVARMLDIKPPSVHAWLLDGIPEGRLRELAAQIEIKSDGRFTRRDRWPDKYAFYWPELSLPASPAPGAGGHETPPGPQNADAAAADLGTYMGERVVFLSPERMPLRLAPGDDRCVIVNGAEPAHPIGPAGAAEQGA